MQNRSRRWPTLLQRHGQCRYDQSGRHGRRHRPADHPARVQVQHDRQIQSALSRTDTFETKPQIALAQLREAIASGIAPGIVLADAGYGDETAFREGITELGLLYAAGIRPATSVWAPGTAPLPPKPWSGRGKPPTLLRRTPGHEPTAVKELAMQLPASAWQTVTWREGTNAALSSRFAAVRVRPAHRDIWRITVRDEEWLLVE